MISLFKAKQMPDEKGLEKFLLDTEQYKENSWMVSQQR